MVRQIAPVFFTMDIPATLAYYTGKLGFACLGTWQDPPVYAIVARDQQVIHFRCAARPPPIWTNTRTNCSTRTSSSKMPTHFMPSTPPKALNSLEDLATCHGPAAISW